MVFGLYFCFYRCFYMLMAFLDVIKTYVLTTCGMKVGIQTLSCSYLMVLRVVGDFVFFLPYQPSLCSPSPLPKLRNKISAPCGQSCKLSAMNALGFSPWNISYASLVFHLSYDFSRICFEWTSVIKFRTEPQP